MFWTKQNVSERNQMNYCLGGWELRDTRDQGMAQVMLVSESLADRGLADCINKVTFCNNGTI